MEHTVLIIDDEYIIRERLKMHLLKAGYNVLGQAEDGLEGERLIKQLNPEIVITDIEMPFLSGIDILEKVRKYNSQIKFVILTGYSEFEYAVSALKNKASEYLLKPINTKQLLKVMSAVSEEIEKEEIADTLLEENKRIKAAKELFTFLSGQKTVEETQFDLIKKPDGRRLVLIYGNKINELQRPDLFILENGLGFMLLPRGAFQLERDLLESKCYFAISSPCFTSNEIKKNYSTLRIVLLSRYFTPDRQIYNNIKLKEPDTVKINSLIQENDNLIAKGQVNTLIKLIENEIKELNTPNDLELYLYLFMVSLRKSSKVSNNFSFQNHSTIWILERFNSFQNFTKFLRDLIQKNIVQSENYIEVDLVDRVKTFLEENYTQPHLNMEIISLHTFAHPNYISSRFKEETGTSVTEYLSDLRLERAYILLKNTSFTCKKISLMVGFHDQYYFSKCFRKKFGITPNSVNNN